MKMERHLKEFTSMANDMVWENINSKTGQNIWECLKMMFLKDKALINLQTKIHGKEAF